MNTPFKLKYKNSAFPFKSPFRQETDNENKQEKAENERASDIKEDIRKGNAPPVTKETLQYYLDAVRGSKDELV